MNIQRGVIACIIALCTVFAVYALPLSTESVRVVKVVDDQQQIVTLRAGERLVQHLQISPGMYSGVMLFLQNGTLGSRGLQASIRDESGKVVAHGYGVEDGYRSSADILQVAMRMPWFRITQAGDYTLDVSFVRGDPPLLVSIPRDASSQRVVIQNEARPALLSLSLLRQTSTDFGMRQGVIVGSIGMIGIALVSLLRTTKKKMIAAIALIILLAPLSVLGLLYPFGDLGIADWDLYIPLHDSYRKALLQYHEFPFWDPYPCGGTAGIGDPEFPLFTPTFLLVLLFGSSVGLRLDIILSMIIGAIGMLVLARKMGRSVEAGFLAAIIVAFGTVNLLESVEGHVNILAWMWVPWIFWAWLGVYRKQLHPIICAVFLALAFLGGGVYLLMYTTLAFIILTILSPRHRDAALVAIRSGAWSLGFVAFKLVPVILWLKQFPDRVYVPSSFTLPWIVDIFFGRHLHDAYVILHQGSGWYEYGAYIGYGTLGLALIGVSLIVRNRIVRALVIASVLSIALSTLGPYLAPILDQVKFFPRSNLSRVILFAVIPMALLAAFGADVLRRRMPRAGRVVQVVLIGFIAIDSISLTYQLSQQAFVLPHVMPLIAPAPYPIAYTPDRYDPAGQGARTTRTTDAYFAGYGTEAYCSVLGPQSAVRTIYDEGDTGIVSAVDSSAKVTLVSWGYNRVVVHVVAPTPTQVILNANYADGWTANGKPAQVISNRVAMHADAGEYDVVFAYHAPGFSFGMLVSLIAICGAVWVVGVKKEKAVS